MPRSSAYSALWMFFVMWSEMSLKKMLNRVGERQLPCGFDCEGGRGGRFPGDLEGPVG